MGLDGDRLPRCSRRRVIIQLWLPSDPGEFDEAPLKAKTVYNLWPDLARLSRFPGMPISV